MVNPMDNELHEQHDPVDESATSAADVELDRRLNELRREFQDDRHELLDKRAESINRWLAVMAIVPAFFGIVAVVAGFISFERFRVLEKETTNRVEQLVNKINNSVVEAEKAAVKIKGLAAQLGDDSPTNSPKIAREVADETIDKPKASRPDKRIASAVSLQQQGKNNEAIKKWRAVAHDAEGSDNEQAANAWFSVGYLSPDPEDRILAYDQAIRLKPDHAVAYNNRGNAKNDLQQYKAAIADYDKAIRLKADYAAAYYNRGYTKNDLQQYKAAIADYDEAIRLKPDLAEAYNNQGNAKNNLQQYKAAIADYDEAIRLKADDAVAYNNRGNTKNNLQQYKAAIADYDKAIRLKPGNAAAYYNRGNAKDNLQQYKAAIADYDEAIRLKPDLAEAYNNRGLAKKELGLTDEARKDFETALELARNAQ